MKNRQPFLKRCDPRVKIFLAFWFAIIIALTYRFSILALAGGFCALLLGLSGLHLNELFKRLGLVNLFLILVVLTLPFTTPGEELFRLGPIPASKEGTIFALLVFLKSNLIILASLCLLSTSSIFSLAHALHHLKVPAKLVQLLFFTFRYLHVIQREFQRLFEAASLRGFTPRTDLFTYRTTAYLVGNLLVRSYDRSQRVYEAMLCRGFSGTFPIYHHFSLRREDLYFGLFGGIYLIFMTILDYIVL